ncbi:myb-like DNA-binding protein bas1 [Pestalotiopsis sp. IQ-011]
MSFPVPERDIALDIAVDDKSTDKSAGPPAVHAVAGINNKVLDLENTEANEVFRLDGQVTTASIMFCEFQIAAGILSIPGSFHDLGAIPASILVFVWGGLSLYGALLMGQFRLNHASIQSVGDAGTLIGGKILGGLVAWILPTGVTMLSVSIAFNTLSDHALCTMAFTAIVAVICTIPALMPKFGQIGVLTWIGFGTFIPASSEMKNPRKYFNRAVYIALTVTTLSYFILPLIVYKYCGQYVASPALASAGPLIKKTAYGIALPGLAITCTLFLHLCGKFIIVKLLRGTRHLQEKTWQHHVSWFCSVVTITIVAFVIATGVPFYSELLSVLVLFTTPNTISLPMLMYNRHFNRKATWYANGIHGLFFIAGLFFGVAGCIVSCININNLYKEGKAGAAFSCADNSV